MDGITDSMDMSLSKLQELVMGNGQGVLVCCGPWGRKESDTTEQLNNHHPLYTHNQGTSWMDKGQPLLVLP